MKRLLTVMALSGAIGAAALADNLEGFAYGNESAPTGKEWENPEALSLNKLQPRAWTFHFADEQSAKSVLPETSSFHKSLDGVWKFHWVAKPSDRPEKFYETTYDVTNWDDIEVPGCWNVQGLGKHGEMKYGVPAYVNQPVMFYHEVRVDDWKGGVMREPKDKRFTTYKYPNEVGSYRRVFTVPAEWKGRNIIINFDGVDSFFYLWINGKYIGFSKNSRNTASFDITPYVSLGAENIVAVEVYRHSDGSFLEAQDMFRLPGIFRSTYLTSTPKVEINDLAVRTESISGQSPVIKVDMDIKDAGKKLQKEYNYTLKVYPVKLYSDEIAGEAIATLSGKSDKAGHETLSLALPGARQWNAEEPYRHILVAQLTDKKGKTIDCVSTFFGVCKVEIRDTPASEDEFGKAGRYLYVNNMPVKLKGVNRHETSLDRGHAIKREQMLEEVFIMKRGNINHIRMSHYSNDPYMYYLCDKYGIYLEDECNIESHEYYYGDASLSHVKEFRAAHVARNMEMVKAHVNAPSIVIWSLGNEAGPGDNFVASYKAIKAFDPRPVQYERNNDIVDMGSNQYPSVGWVRYAVQGTDKGIKYPYHISEYAHSMGNSMGNLQDYWDAIESTNFFCGGAIWDWVDQAIWAYTPDGTRYMGYGGDHGEWPNDGMFCMNGIILPDFTPKPQYFEVKKVYQNVGVKADFDNNAIKVFNKNYFTSLQDYEISWTLVKDGKAVNKGQFIADRSIQGPRQEKIMRLPFKVSEIAPDGEYFLNVEFRLTRDMPWAKAGYVQMDEQLPLGIVAARKPLFVNGRDILKINTAGGNTVIEGINFTATFNNANGSLDALKYGDNNVIEQGNGLKLDAFRAPVDNDNWAWNQWFQQGLYNLQHKAASAPITINNPDGSVSLVYNVVSQAPCQGRVQWRPGKAGQPVESLQNGREMTENDFHFTTTVRYTVYPDGTIALNSSIVSSDAGLNLPRLGYALKMPAKYDQYTYYGRGPLNNYADRKTGSFVGLYKSTVKDQFVNFPKPQSMGNREDVRWCVLTDKAGNGVQFVSLDKTMSTSALPWSALEMTLAQHPYELPASTGTHLHLDCQVTGLGGNSCGQGGPLEHDCTKGALHQMSLLIRPVSTGTDYVENAAVMTSTRCPIAIIADRAGKVSIEGHHVAQTLDKPSQPILYTIEQAAPAKGKKAKALKPVVYNGQEIDMRAGGTITAWYEGEDKVKTTATFQKIESVPVEVVYVSSEEGPGGEVAKNLVDGDANTIWHTMYSITVPKYPHWVDFDCIETKNIKGFTYLPRQDGPNGNIKGYKVQLSQDGKTWGDVVAEGEFANDQKLKKVLFKTPQKARYLRFTATSSQNGADFASGAEFTIIAD